MRCPYCGSAMNGQFEPLPFSARQKAVYDAVVKAGPDGILKRELLLVMYGRRITPGAKVVMRVTVHYINKQIRAWNQTIDGSHGGVYRLQSLKEK